MEKDSIKAKMIELFKKIVNRETITYIIAGVLTTLVNFISYESLYRLGIPNLRANAMAWVIAVIFAYIVNKINVFQSKSETIKAETMKLTMFFGARLITLGIEQAGMYLFTERKDFNRLIVKACIAVIVIILNYFFSKLFIFNRKK
ncbi:MAG: GtrA family protein [Mobilitalea sp.]